MDENRSTEELLSEIYRSVTMGSENLGNVIPMISDKFLMRRVTCQMEQYSAFAEEAGAMLKHRAVKPEKLSLMKKLASRTGTAVNTLFDSSNRHIADMIVKGTKMGADSLEKTLCRLSEQGAETCAVELARNVVDFERTEGDKMKDFT